MGLYVVYLGFRFGLLPDWEDRVAPPPRGNMKDETYEAKLPALRQAQSAALLQRPRLNVAAVKEFAGFRPADDKGQRVAGYGMLTLAKALLGLWKEQSPLVICSLRGTARLLRSMAWCIARSRPSDLGLSPWAYGALARMLLPKYGLSSLVRRSGSDTVYDVDLYVASGAYGDGIPESIWLREFVNAPPGYGIGDDVNRDVVFAEKIANKLTGAPPPGHAEVFLGALSPEQD